MNAAQARAARLRFSTLASEEQVDRAVQALVEDRASRVEVDHSRMFVSSKASHEPIFQQLALPTKPWFDLLEIQQATQREIRRVTGVIHFES